MLKSCLILTNMCVVIVIWTLIYNFAEREHKQVGLSPFPVSRRLDEQYANYDKFVRGSNISLNDIHITMKTKFKNHRQRIALLVKTWIKASNIKVFVITDTEDMFLKHLSGLVVSVTGCGKLYHLSDLCCKTGQEFLSFMKSNKTWWCHFDDDVYLNTKALLKLLRGYSYLKRYYLGKRSISHGFKIQYKGALRRAQFGTGAGYCISRTLAKCAAPYLSGSAMVKTCEGIGFNDDVTIAFASTFICNTTLTESNLFHPHYETLSESMENSTIKDQVLFSYDGNNVTPFHSPFQPVFSESEDPTRFLSIHCILYPQDDICP